MIERTIAATLPRRKEMDLGDVALSELPDTIFDVVICSGGLAGLTHARPLKRALVRSAKDRSVRNIHKLTGNCTAQHRWEIVISAILSGEPNSGS